MKACKFCGKRMKPPLESKVRRRSEKLGQGTLNLEDEWEDGKVRASSCDPTVCVRCMKIVGEVLVALLGPPKI